MYSYPNLIPLPAHAVRRIAASVRPFQFECMYGAWDGRTVISGGKDAVERSAERYLRGGRLVATKTLADGYARC